MKRTILVLMLSSCSLFAQAQKTWTGGASDGLFSTAGNWSDNTSPSAGSNEIYIFDGTSPTSCTIDVNVDCNEIQVLSGYTATIDMSGITVFINNLLIINDGTVIAPTGALQMVGTGTFSLGGGGTFTHNNGSFEIYSNGSQIFTFSGSIVLNNLTLLPTVPSSLLSRSIDFGSNLSVNNFSLNNTSSKIYAFQGIIHIKNSMGLGNASHTTNSASNSADFIFDGSSASLIGSSSSGAGKAYLPNIEINTSGTYSMSGNINVRGNWTGTQGTLSVGTSTVNIYNSAASLNGTAIAFDNLVIQTGASLTFPASSEIQVAKSLVNNGTIVSDPTTLLTLNGNTTAQTISGTAFTMGSVRAKSGSRTITLSTGLTIQDSLKLESNVTFAAGNNLTIDANANLKGRVAEIASGATVTGNVGVKTFIPGGTAGWANIGIAGVNGQSIGSWDNQLPMTCDGCTYGPGDVTGTFYSIQGWNEGADDYDTTITSATALTPGQGFWLYVGTNTATATDYTLLNSGTLVQGNVPVSLTNGGTGWNLIANPYASPINWDKVMTSNSTNTNNLQSTSIYAWNADDPTTHSQYSPGSGVSGGTGFDNQGNLSAGQGFYIETFGAFSLNFHEADKVDQNDVFHNLFKSKTSSATKFQLRVQGFNQDDDRTMLHFNGNATENFDKVYDAKKLFQTPGYMGYPAPYTWYTSISTFWKNQHYGINTLPELNKTYTIPVLVRVMATGFYTISVSEQQNLNSCLLLYDKLNGTYHNLANGPYVCQISDTTSTPRFELSVCEYGNTTTNLTELNISSSDIFILQDNEGPVVKTRFSEATKARISVYNLLGQCLINDLEVYGTETSTRLNVGVRDQVIFVQVNTNAEKVTQKLLLR